MAKCERKEVLTVSCLGRPIRLGMLYDCQNEKVIPDLCLWDNNYITQKSISKRNPSFDVKVSAETRATLPSKKFDLCGDLHSSSVSGLVEGSDPATNTATEPQVCIMLRCVCKTFYQELPMDLMSGESYDNPEALNQGTATHVVCGVQYGANVVFVFEKDVEENEDQHQVEVWLKEVAEKIPTFDLSFDRITILSVQDKLETNKVRCSYYGDFLKHVTTTFEEVLNTFNKFHGLITMTDEEQGEIFGLPVEVSLSPLSQLDDNAAGLVNLTHNTDSTVIGDYLQQCSSLLSIASSMMSHDICWTFPGIGHQIDSFRNNLTKHLSGLHQMTQSLPKIREGQPDETTLAEILSKIEGSPFSILKMDHWLNAKKKEIAYLSNVCNRLSEYPFAKDDVELNRLTCDDNVKCVVELHFGLVTRKSHSFLTAMSAQLKQLELSNFKYTNIVTDDDDFNEDFHWLNDDSNVSKLEKSLEIFKSFATANLTNQNLRLIIGTGFGIKNSQDSPGNMYLHLGSKILFEPPSTPGVPQMQTQAENEIELKWDEPRYGAKFVISYVVQYRFAQTEDDIFTRNTKNDHAPKIVMTRLKEDSLYCFRVAAQCEAGISKFSDWSQPIKTLEPPPLGLSMLNQCKQISKARNGEPAWYQLPLQRTYLNEQSQIQKFDVFEPNLSSTSNKVVLLLGATGSGKTTLINGLANYILGIRMEDDYRFQLITENTNKSQAESQTVFITAYTIHWQPGSKVPFTLTIIDTPGYGDTGGIYRDIFITNQVREFFEMKGHEAIDQVDAIGFVAPAPARLTDTQKYVFDSILSIFGNDIIGNIFLMLTFADGRPPPILDAIKAHQLPYQNYFKFNNSVFTQLKLKDAFATSESTIQSSSNFDSLFWKLATESFHEFFVQLNMVDVKSLKLTREVLQERNILNITIDGLQQYIASGVNHLEEMRQHLLVIEELQVEKKANKNFYRTVQVPKTKKTYYQEEGRHVTNCLNCNFTCHLRCAIFDDDKKNCCAAMVHRGKNDACCRNCAGKCHWSKHFNKNYYYESYMEDEVVTLRDLKIKYDTAEENLSFKERLISGVACMYTKLQLAILDNIETVRKCLARLDEIAMKPNPLTTVDYIEILIKNAEREKKQGWQQSIMQLEAAKERALMLMEMVSKDVEYDPFRTIKQQILDQCKNSKPNVFKKIKNILGFGKKVVGGKYLNDEFVDVGNDVCNDVYNDEWNSEFMALSIW